MKRIKVKHKLLIVDACYSAFLNPYFKKGAPVFDQPKKLSAIEKEMEVYNGNLDKDVYFFRNITQGKHSLKINNWEKTVYVESNKIITITAVDKSFIKGKEIYSSSSGVEYVTRGGSWSNYRTPDP